MAEAIKGYNLLYANYAAITSVTTLVTGQGYLGTLVCNKAGSANFTITLYDDTGTTTKIATITNPTVGLVFPYNCKFKNGLRILTTGDTSGDITITYAPLG